MSATTATRSSHADLFCGIDLGTSDTKALLLDAEGCEVASASAPTRWHGPGGQPVLTDVRGLYAAALAATGQAVAEAERTLGRRVRVRAVGTTGMAETGALLGADGEPVVDSIAWHDQRGAELLHRLPAEVVDAFAATTGLSLTGLVTLAKFLWWHEHEPASKAAVAWLDVPEYVAHRLGGERVVERSLASRLGLLDQHTGAWWPLALAAADLSERMFPPLVAAGTPVGVVTDPDAPPALRGAVLTVAGHDHLVAAVGVGAYRDGDVFDSCGTAEALIRGVPGVNRDQILALNARGVAVGRHVVPDRHALLAGLRGGLALRRVQRVLGIGSLAEQARLDAEVLALGFADAGDDSVTVSGLGLRDEAITISGITDATSQARVWRAALRAANEISGRELAAIDGVVGPHARVVAAGGWTRSPAYRAAKAWFGQAVTFSSTHQAGCRGAAMFAAWAAAGRPPDFAGFMDQFGAPADPGPHVQQADAQQPPRAEAPRSDGGEVR